MFRTLSNTAKAGIFIAGVLLISFTTAGIAGGLILAVSPLLMVLLMMLVITRDGYHKAAWRDIGLAPLGLRWWPVTLLVTTGVSALSYAGVVGLGAASFGISAEAGSNLLSLCISGPILAFTEEIGWRGYLQSHLSQRFSRLWSWLIVAVVWICWHLPYILFTPFYHAEGNRVLVLMLFASSVFAFSILFGFLRDRSGSVWPAVLAHFGHNAAFAWIGTDLIHTEQPVLVSEYLAGDTGLLVLLGTVLSAGLLLYWNRHDRAGHGVRSTSGSANPVRF